MLYNENITRKSYLEMLKFLKFANNIKEIPLLFGGWAVYQYNSYAGSKDVDFAVSDENFNKCVNFLVKENGYTIQELRLKKDEIFFDLYKRSEGIEDKSFDYLYNKAERIFLRGTSYEVFLPSLQALFMSKLNALVKRDVPKDKSDVIALLIKFNAEDFENLSFSSAEQNKLETLINKIDIFSLVIKPTKKNIDEINGRLKRLLQK